MLYLHTVFTLRRKIILTDREALEMFLNCELGYPDEVFDKFVMLEARYFG